MLDRPAPLKMCRSFQELYEQGYMYKCAFSHDYNKEGTQKSSSKFHEENFWEVLILLVSST